MVSYKIYYRSSVLKKDFKSIPQIERKKIIEKIVLLSENPRPEQCLKMSGEDNCYRLRIGKYRVVYKINDHEMQIQIEHVGHRKDIYR